MAYPRTGPVCASGSTWRKYRGEIGPNLGDPFCDDLTESDPVFCGNDGILRARRDACTGGPVASDDVTSAGLPRDLQLNDSFYSPVWTKLTIPANTSTCKWQSIMLQWDPTATVSIFAEPYQCYPLWKDVCPKPTGDDKAVEQPEWYPPKQTFAAVQFTYEWRTIDGGIASPWGTILQQTTRDSDVFGSNSHKMFTFLNMRRPGAPASQLEVRTTYRNVGTGGIVAIAGETSLLHGAIMYFESCGMYDPYQTAYDDDGKKKVDNNIVTDQWIV